MILEINTANNETIVLSLKQGKKIIDQISLPARREQAEKLLPGILKLLKNHKLKPEDLKGIDVETKGNSFTALRIGVITANALAFALKIPLNGKRQIVKPRYNREPNIG